MYEKILRRCLKDDPKIPKIRVFHDLNIYIYVCYHNRFYRHWWLLKCVSICFSWNSAIDSFHIYIYTSVGIQYAFEGSSSWHILCWQDCWISTLRYFQYHWKSSLMRLFLMKNWFTRSICNDLWPTSLFWENILLPDYGHHWVAIFVWMPFWSKSKTRLYRKISKSSCHFSWWTNSVKPVDW